MNIPRAEDAIHRAQLYRLLIEIVDHDYLSKSLVFKGGTCASLLQKLDRFSVDLDFDLKSEVDQEKVKIDLEEVFTKLRLEIKDSSKNTIQYFLRYEPQNARLTRNTLKLEAVTTSLEADKFKAQYLLDIDRYMVCQTIETMFAHKLVAITDRYEKNGSIAGRDLYDIHYYFMNLYKYDAEVIKERTGMEAVDYLSKLSEFIEEKITNKVIDEDLNMLLTPDQFNKIRRSLKQEVLSFLAEERNGNV